MKTFRMTVTIQVTDEKYNEQIKDLKKEILEGDFKKDMLRDEDVVDCNVSFEDLSYNLTKEKEKN